MDINNKIRTIWMDTKICPICSSNLIYKKDGTKITDYNCERVKCLFNINPRTKFIKTEMDKYCEYTNNG